MSGRNAATISLGFLFIAVVEWVTSAVGAGWYAMPYPGVAVGAWLGLGVAGLFVAGILAVLGEDGLHGTLFLAWAGFYLAGLLAYLWMPGGHPASMGLAAWLLLFWGVFALFLWIAALGSGFVRTLFLFAQWVALILLAASTWTHAPMVGLVGHYFAMASALAALYQAVGTIVNYSQGRVLLHGCGFIEA